MEVNLVGDSAHTLLVLLPLIERKANRPWENRVIRWTRCWRELREDRASANSRRDVSPQRPVGKLTPRLPDDAVITSYSGSRANWFARDLKIRSSMSLPGRVHIRGLPS